MARPSKRRRQDLTAESTPERKGAVPTTRPATPSATSPGAVPATRPATPSATRPGTAPAPRPGAAPGTPAAASSPARPRVQGAAGRTSPPAPGPRRGGAPPARRGTAAARAGPAIAPSGSRFHGRGGRALGVGGRGDRGGGRGGRRLHRGGAHVPQQERPLPQCQPAGHDLRPRRGHRRQPQVSSTIAAGGVTDPLEPVTGCPAALTGPSGSPELFYYGAEYCPYCAAERWSVVIALSRFGTLQQPAPHHVGLQRR